MLHKTQGIVINYVRFRESSIIVKIYTQKFGIQTYIENGVRSSKGKNKIALFQPLTLLDMVVYHDDRKSIHRISEVKCLIPYISLPYDIAKSSIAMFLDEMLNKTLQEQTENEVLFDFLRESLLVLDLQDDNFENFHLIFLLKLSFFLGFSPQSSQEMFEQFKEFSMQIPYDLNYERLLNHLIWAEYTTPLQIGRLERIHLLDIIILFYKIHIEGLGEIKSLQVLHEIFG